MRGRLSGRGLLLGVVGLLMVAVGVGSALGAIPDKGVYNACLTKSTGVIKVINYPKVKCAKRQRLISWSQQGPAGAQGAQGVQGVQGPAGPADWNAIPNKPAGFALSRHKLRLPRQARAYARALSYCLSRYPVRNIHAITAMQMAMIAAVTRTLDHSGTSAIE